MISRIILNNSKCVIRERKKKTNKPKYYVWDIDRACYISSLYKTSKSNIYVLEYQGIIYKIDIETGKIMKNDIEKLA